MSHQAFLARQPIVDTKQNIVAYELLFRFDGATDAAHVSDELDASLQVLVNAVGNMGTDWVLGDKIAFINMGESLLSSGFTELLPADRAVLEILETVRVTDELVERLRGLRSRGFRFALDDFEHTPSSEPLLEVADFVKLDLLNQHAPLEDTVRRLRQYPVKLVAEKVETRAAFEAARNLGFDFFQGYFFARPETLSTRTINPSYQNLLDLLNKVRVNADVRNLEMAFKRDVALSFKLLRYINSVGFGLSCEIQSIRHAIAVLGMQQLYRWLTLLLVTAGGDSVPPALVKTAVTRGRLTELLGARLLPKVDQDNLFIVGVFSMLDVMMDTPMNELLDKITLPEPVAEALANRAGVYGPFLSLAEACETPDPDRISELSASLALSPAQVNEAHVQALAWVERLGI